VSGRVVDVADDPAHQPQVLIQSKQPLSVLVTFDTFRILPDGQEEPGGRVLFTPVPEEVPGRRTTWPASPSGRNVPATL